MDSKSTGDLGNIISMGARTSNSVEANNLKGIGFGGQGDKNGRNFQSFLAKASELKDPEKVRSTANNSHKSGNIVPMRPESASNQLKRVDLKTGSSVVTATEHVSETSLANFMASQGMSGEAISALLEKDHNIANASRSGDITKRDGFDGIGLMTEQERSQSFKELGLLNREIGRVEKISGYDSKKLDTEFDKNLVKGTLVPSEVANVLKMQKEIGNQPGWNNIATGGSENNERLAGKLTALQSQALGLGFNALNNPLANQNINLRSSDRLIDSHKTSLNTFEKNSLDNELTLNKASKGPEKHIAEGVRVTLGGQVTKPDFSDVVRGGLGLKLSSEPASIDASNSHTGDDRTGHGINNGIKATIDEEMIALKRSHFADGASFKTAVFNNKNIDHEISVVRSGVSIQRMTVEPVNLSLNGRDLEILFQSSAGNKGFSNRGDEGFSESGGNNAESFAQTVSNSQSSNIGASNLQGSSFSDIRERAELIQKIGERLNQAVADRVISQVARGSWSIEMELHPSELGQIDVDMKMTENGIEAGIRASQGVTREMLAESLNKLRDLLEDSGLSVSDISLQQESSNNSDLERKARENANVVASGSEKRETQGSSVLSKPDRFGDDGLDILV